MFKIIIILFSIFLIENQAEAGCGFNCLKKSGEKILRDPAGALADFEEQRRKDIENLGEAAKREYDNLVESIEKTKIRIPVLESAITNITTKIRKLAGKKVSAEKVTQDLVETKNKAIASKNTILNTTSETFEKTRSGLEGSLNEVTQNITAVTKQVTQLVPVYNEYTNAEKAINKLKQDMLNARAESVDNILANVTYLKGYTKGFQDYFHSKDKAWQDWFNSKSDVAKGWISVQPDSFLSTLASTPGNFQDWFVEQSLDFRDTVALKGSEMLSWVSSLDNNLQINLASLDPSNLDFALSLDLGPRTGMINLGKDLGYVGHLGNIIYGNFNNCISGGCDIISACLKSWDNVCDDLKKVLWGIESASEIQADIDKIKEIQANLFNLIVGKIDVGESTFSTLNSSINYAQSNNLAKPSLGLMSELLCKPGVKVCHPNYIAPVERLEDLEDDSSEFEVELKSEEFGSPNGNTKILRNKRNNGNKITLPSGKMNELNSDPGVYEFSDSDVILDTRSNPSKLKNRQKKPVKELTLKDWDRKNNHFKTKKGKDDKKIVEAVDGEGKPHVLGSEGAEFCNEECEQEYELQKESRKPIGSQQQGSDPFSYAISKIFDEVGAPLVKGVFAGLGALNNSLKNSIENSLPERKELNKIRKEEKDKLAQCIEDYQNSDLSLTFLPLVAIDENQFSEEGVLSECADAAVVNNEKERIGQAKVQIKEALEGQISKLKTKYDDKKSQVYENNRTIKNGPNGTIQSKDLFEGGYLTTELAKQANDEGDVNAASKLLQAAHDTLGAVLSPTFLDFAVDFIPGVGNVRAVAELVAGKNLVTGEEYDSIDYVFGAVGVLLPVAGKAGKAFKNIYKRLRKVEKAGSAADATKTLAKKSADKIDEAENAIANAADCLTLNLTCSGGDIFKGAKLDEVIETANKIGISDTSKVIQLAETTSQTGTEVLSGVRKSESFKRAVKATPADKLMFYRSSVGEAIPSTGYRYVPSSAAYLDELVSTGRIPARSPTAIDPYKATYFGFDKFDDAATASSKFQVPHDAAIRVEFDTLQIVDDVRIPNGKWNTEKYLEPITKDYPEHGVGGAAQAVTNSEIRASKIVDLNTGEVLYERK